MLNRDIGPFLTEKIGRALRLLALDRSDDSSLTFDDMPIGVVVATLASQSKAFALADVHYPVTVIAAARTSLLARHRSIRQAHQAFIEMIEDKTFLRDKVVTESVLLKQRAYERFADRRERMALNRNVVRSPSLDAETIANPAVLNDKG